jgi:ABC-2 type transport system ATP-binding protein
MHADASGEPLMSNAVELCGVTKRYDEFVAVDHLTFAIREGSVFGLLGPNGAGKTSTIRMMMGITLPDEGEVFCFGEKFERKHLERIGYMPEERGLYKKMKVLEHLVFLGQLKGLTEAEARRRALAWADKMEISDWMKNKVEELSKGMQQKIQFIATLLHDPPLIIMDEPFSGLDPANAVQLKDVLIELKKSGKTILFSTHRMDTVERLCDTICLVDHGRPILMGELKQVKSSYGKNSVHVEYEGSAAFLQEKSLVESYNDYGNYVEVKLVHGADSQALLRTISERARVNKFELVEPSLEAIFIDVVKKNEVAVNA